MTTKYLILHKASSKQGESCSGVRNDSSYWVVLNHDYISWTAKQDEVVKFLNMKDEERPTIYELPSMKEITKADVTLS
jgi:hypothetical protein